MEGIIKFVVELVYLNGLYMELFPLPDYFGNGHCISLGNVSSTNCCKTQACTSALQALLIRHAIWESVQLPQPTQYRIEAGVMVGAKISLP